MIPFEVYRDEVVGVRVLGVEWHYSQEQQYRIHQTTRRELQRISGGHTHLVGEGVIGKVYIPHPDMFERFNTLYVVVNSEVE